MDNTNEEEKINRYLGIDIGTTHCKVALGTGDGRILDRAETSCTLEFPRDGWVEVDPEKVWWSSVLQSIRSLLGRNDLKGFSIRGIGVSCTNALVCLDRDGKPLRKAIMQLDRRATAAVVRIEETLGKEDIFEITGNRAAPGTFLAPSLLWIRQHQPALFEKIVTLLSPAGYIIHRLTGVRVMDHTRAATTLLYDPIDGKWSDHVVSSLKIPEGTLPEIRSPCHVVGKVSEEASRSTGLKAGIPVTAGVMDSVAAAVGMGTTNPGEVGIILGTVGRVLWPLDGPTFDDRFLNVPLLEPGKWISVACTNGTGLSINWFVENLMRSEGSTSEEESLNLFDEEASASSPGSNGLLYLPFLAGERSPLWDPRAKGLFFGLDARHTRGDLARAILEGTAFSIRDNLEILEEVTGIHTEGIRLSGGGARSSIWLSILSSVLGKELRVSSQEDSECRGAIILSAAGVKKTNREDLLHSDDRIEERRIIPKGAGEKKRYDALFRQYREIYRDLRVHFERLHETMTHLENVEKTSS